MHLWTRYSCRYMMNRHYIILDLMAFYSINSIKKSVCVMKKNKQKYELILKWNVICKPERVFSISCRVKYLYQTPHSPTCRGFPAAAVPARQPDGVSGEGGLPQVSLGGDDHLQRPLRHQGTAGWWNLKRACSVLQQNYLILEIDMSILNCIISVIFRLPVSLLKCQLSKCQLSKWTEAIIMLIIYFG